MTYRKLTYTWVGIEGWELSGPYDHRGFSVAGVRKREWFDEVSGKAGVWEVGME